MGIARGTDVYGFLPVKERIMEENIVLIIEGHEGWGIETNLGWETDAAKWCADVWREQKTPGGYKYKLIESFSGEHSLTDAVLFLSEILADCVAYRIRRSK